MEARCEDGQMIVNYVTGEQTAKTEVWSEGHPLRCTNDLAEPGTLNGEPVSDSEGDWRSGRSQDRAAKRLLIIYLRGRNHDRKDGYLAGYSWIGAGRQSRSG